MSQPVFKNPYVSSAPALTGPSVGDGTLTIDRVTHFTIDQDYTAVCTAIAPFTVFKIIGSLDGAVGVAVVGTQFVDQDLKVFLTIEQGPTLFAIGDTFEFSLAQGTDLNRENIDLYDEQPQKNFGAGVAGSLSGDHNLRFSLSGIDASLVLGDLSFVSNLVDKMEGNEIAIEFIEGSFLSPATLTLQDLTYTADAPGAAGNNISIAYVAHTPGEYSSRNIQDIAYTAQTIGSAGDLISIEYVGGGTAGLEVAGVIGTDITVTIEDGVSTANQIRAALAAVPAIVALISASETGTGLEPQSVQSQLFLQGGVDPVGLAGSEVVSVLGNAISVILESGVSTAQQVKDAIDAFPAAAALVDVSVSGTASNPQTSPVVPTNLANGTEDVGIPGSEIVTVTGDKHIQVTFITGQSTAQQISDAMNLVSAVTTLITIGIPGTAANPQDSNVAKTYLKGGRPDNSYVFNAEELSDPTAFFEGNGSLSVKDLITQGRLLVVENAKFNENIDVDGDANVGGNLDVTGNETVDGNSLIGGNKTIQGNMTVEGQTWLNGILQLDDEVDPTSGPVVYNAQKVINNLIQNGKVLARTSNGEDPQWLPPTLSLSTDDIILKFLDTGVTNTILNANFPQTVNDGEVLYVTVDRDTTGNVALQKAATVPTGENIVIIGLRSGGRFLWNMNLFLDDLQTFEGILLLKQHDTNLKRTEILPGTKLLPDATVLGATIDDLLLTFPGAEIDWVNGKVYEGDGITDLGLDFTLPAITAGLYKWASVTLVATPPDPQNEVTGQIDIEFGADENADPDLAKKPGFVEGGIPLGFVLLQGDGVTTINDILQDDIIQMPLGAGGGGGGVGDITGIMEELRANFRRLDYTWLTEWDGRIDEQNLEDSTTAGGFGGGYQFASPSENFISTNLYGDRFMSNDRISKKVRLELFQDPEALVLDTSFIAQLSQDGGNNYYTVTMNRIGLSRHWYGEFEFPQDILQILNEYDDANTDSNLDFDNASGKGFAIPIDVIGKHALQKLSLYLNKIGNPSGNLIMSIVRDDGGAPSELLEDVFYSETKLISNIANGDSTVEFDLGVVNLPGDDVFWIVLKTDAAYKSSYIFSTDALAVHGDSSHSYSQDFFIWDGASWSDMIDGITFKVEGFSYDLKLKYIAGNGDSVLQGFGVMFGEYAQEFEVGSKQVEYFIVDGDLDQTTFPVNNFIVDAKQLKVYDPSIGKVYRWSQDAITFDVDGQNVIFPAGTFDVPGEVFTLIFDQTLGGFDNSDENAQLLADNHLGSSNASVSRAKAGKGIKLMKPNTTLQHVWVDDGGNLIIEDA